MAKAEADLSELREYWKDPNGHTKIADLEHQLFEDPFPDSRLRYWLALEVWDREEGLQVLSGVTPGSVRLADDDDPFFAGTGLAARRWISGDTFRLPSFDFLRPPPYLNGFSPSAREEMKRRELMFREIRESLLDHCRRVYQHFAHKLDHSPSALGEPIEDGRWRPVAFLAWALRVGFKPEWYGWAQSQGLLPDGLDPMFEPFFDADAENYPELLAIAIRAWTAAKSMADGTPKQRVLAYLGERHPDLLPSTKEAIALVANWQKAGGRPRRNG
jgi:hypothetical protein